MPTFRYNPPPNWPAPPPGWTPPAGWRPDPSWPPPPPGWTLWVVAGPSTSPSRRLRGAIGRVYLGPSSTAAPRKVFRAALLGLLTVILLAAPFAEEQPAPAAGSAASTVDQRSGSPAPDVPRSTPTATPTPTPTPTTATASSTPSARQAPKPAPPPDPRPASVPATGQVAVVERIVDGDTIALRAVAAGAALGSTAQVTVRLLEVDTPESKRPGTPVQCYANEATTYLSRLTPPGSRVWVTADLERRDRYGRYLLYVWSAKGAFVNYNIVRTGNGKAVLYEPNDRYIDAMREAESQARSERRGLWRACAAPKPAAAGPAAPRPSPPPAPEQPAVPRGPVPGVGADCPRSHPVKGNGNSGIYHVPGGRYYDVTVPEECFRTAADAEAAGYRASRGG